MTERRVTSLVFYGLTAFGVFAFCAVFGPNPSGVVVAPIPVAVYASRRRMGEALGLVACAVLAALAMGGGFRAMVVYALHGSAGLPLGIGLSRRWFCGWIAAAVTACVVAALLIDLATGFQEWKAYIDEINEAVLAQIKQAEQQMPADQYEGLLRNFGWYRAHWVDLVPGVFTLPVLASTCLVVFVMGRWTQRRDPEIGCRGQFRTMRPPEWLVWVVIATALAWFADQYWPTAWLRTMSWNAALVLAFIYALNGLSILAYVASVLRPNALFYVAVAVVFSMLGGVPLLSLLGLFDTWSHFRRHVDRLHKAISGRNGSDGGP